MKRLSLNRIRRENKQALKQYESYGTRLFLDALKKQAVEYSPQIMEDAYITFYQTVFVDSAKREFDRIRQQNRKEFIPDGFFLETWRSFIGSYVVQNLNEIYNKVNDNTFKMIENTLAQAVTDGLNPFQTQKLLNEIISNPKRALAIARTESTRANAMGKQKSADEWRAETGQELWKTWIHGGSREARESHLEMQALGPIPEKEPFSVGGGMMLPGEVGAPPEETINCSCTVQFVSEDYVRRFHPEKL
jgi:hypothetical protein